MGARLVKLRWGRIEDREWLASRIGGKKKCKGKDNKGINDRRGNTMQREQQSSKSLDPHKWRRRNVCIAAQEEKEVKGTTISRHQPIKPQGTPNPVNREQRANSFLNCKWWPTLDW